MDIADHFNPSEFLLPQDSRQFSVSPLSQETALVNMVQRSAMDEICISDAEIASRLSDMLNTQIELSNAPFSCGAGGCFILVKLIEDALCFWLVNCSS